MWTSEAQNKNVSALQEDDGEREREKKEKKVHHVRSQELFLAARMPSRQLPCFYMTGVERLPRRSTWSEPAMSIGCYNNHIHRIILAKQIIEREAGNVLVQPST